MVQKVRSNNEIVSLLKSKCCEKDCIQNLSLTDIKTVEEMFASKSNSTEQNNWILDFILQHTSNREDGTKDVCFIIRGRRVCREAWRMVHGISTKRLMKIIRDSQNNQMVYTHGNKGKRKLQEKTTDCIAWFKFFVACIGDQQPDSEKIHLPSCFTKKALYEKMEGELRLNGKEVVSRSQWYNVWEDHFKDVLIPKENAFSKCDDCTRYKNVLESTLDKRQRQQAQEYLQGHLALVMRERAKYHLHRVKARKLPQRYLTVIIDAMDNKKTHIPRERRMSKSVQGVVRLRTHLVGAIAHSGLAEHGKKTFCCFDLFEYPHDPNLTITVLLEVLKSFKDNLAEVLYLQLDNCWKENKNKYVMFFLALLVELLVFDKIRGNFLPVGHTHEDIDGKFGNYSQVLSRTDVYTFEDLLATLQGSTSTPHPEASRLSVVFDVKSWLGPHGQDLHRHVNPHCFKFVRDPETQKALMYYRKWSSDNWMGPIQLLKELPEGVPDIVQPSLRSIDAESMRRDIPKFYKFMPPLAVDQWKERLLHLDIWLLRVPERPYWPLEDLLRATRPPLPENEEEAVASLQLLRDKEMAPIKEITTGPLRRGENRAVQEVEDHIADLELGSFIAVNLLDWDETPVIGKVTAIHDDHVTIHYWKGTYESSWKPDYFRTNRRNVEWKQDLPKEVILLSNFTLTRDKYLRPETATYLKDVYSRIDAEKNS